jgi:AraC-like DNA-binding protein
MQYYVKNMVCNRCIMAVEKIFTERGFAPVHIELGEVETAGTIPEKELSLLGKDLVNYGFEMIDDSRSRIIEKIKNTIIQLIHHSSGSLKINYSAFIESKLGKDYSYLSHLFSEVEGTTIEKYIINQKIERVKELLVYNELSLSEIADIMDYSNVAYLSGQFKKITGLTPSHFRQIKEKKRKPLDLV